MGGKNNIFNKTVSNLGLSGSGGIFGGASSLQNKGAFAVSQDSLAAEREALQRQQAIASGQAPSISEMQLNQAMQQSQQAQAQAAAGARGINPALAFRAASDASAQAQLDAGTQAAILREQERRNADQLIAQIVAGQRGVALDASQGNLQAKEGYRQQTLGFLSGLGQQAIAAKGGAGKGGAGGAK